MEKEKCMSMGGLLSKYKDDHGEKMKKKIIETWSNTDGCVDLLEASGNVGDKGALVGLFTNELAKDDIL